MKTLKFMCKLLSDVILNQKAASEGPNKTLDFIPGSCFLGIVANALYKENNPDTWEIVHSGNVRFGDAHPACIYRENDNDKDCKMSLNRSLKTPVALQTTKAKGFNGSVYLYHAIPNPLADVVKNKQLKSSKEGFFDFSIEKSDNVKRAVKVNVDNSFAIKSKQDSVKRRSEDEKMYGYDSLNSGQCFYFEVELQSPIDENVIIDKLSGTQRIGRSKTAQYGLVDISICNDMKQIPSSDGSCEIKLKGSKLNCVTVYADGRLIFMDDNLLPTFDITADGLGVKGGKIVWEKSQIRQFQYSPWNYTRQCFDGDRCGFEKGSVFVVDISDCKEEDIPSESNYVGSFNNEGFGKVIYNPVFLINYKNNGEYQYSIDLNKAPKPDSISEEERIRIVKDEIINLKKGNSLMNFLASKKEEDLINETIFKLVNDFVDQKGNCFTGDSFKSQWGTIRAIAMQNPSYSSLERELFTKVDKDNKPNAYLTHGVAKDKWNKFGRYDKFKTFFTSLNKEGNFAQRVVINLASQMAKHIK